jgi:threonine aldolase
LIANKTFSGIDLSSDTATQPTMGMKIAMMSALLGDEQKNEDPTTSKLELLVANLLGQDYAIFLPSATMANIIAIRLLCQPGDVLITAEHSHLLMAEGGGPAIHSGVLVKPIQTGTGVFTGEDICAAYRRSKSPRCPRTNCVSVENTTNLNGGIAWELTALHSVLMAAQELDLRTHLDGSRLFNAAIKININSKKLASNFDTVTLCLSKGLGCPVGAILAFKKNYYESAIRLKHLFGGALRQSGMLAAAGLYALEHNVLRLAEDHHNAEYLFEKLNAEVKEISLEHKALTTNMVFFNFSKSHLAAYKFHQLCIELGLRLSHIEKDRFRAVTHLGINKNAIDKAVAIIKKVVKS